MNHERKLACAILDIFEDLLNEYDLVIDSEDRKEVVQAGEEVAALYGEEYFSLEDKITDLLEKNEDL
jgi:hypothetical protein